MSIPVGGAPPWATPSAHPVLDIHDVHVWRAFFDASGSLAEKLANTLSPDERRRAERFHFEKHRRRYVCARSVLRALLGNYLDREPSTIRFCYGRHGKPALDKDSGSDTVRFNVSHCDDVVLYAVTRGREVGTDVERIRPEWASAQIAEQCFSQDLATLLASGDHGWPRHFFSCWTRREAYLKARGVGLAGAPDELLSDEEWVLRELIPRPGYIGAVAVKGNDWQISCWHWG